MRKALMVALCFEVFSTCSAAYALADETGDPVPGKVEQLRTGPGGDPRAKKVEWCDGCVIPLVGARGQSLPIELPKGWIATGVIPSEQDVMSGTTVINPQTQQVERVQFSDAAPNPQKQEDLAAQAESGNNGCFQNNNLQICIRRDRFIYVRPATDLTKQTFPVMTIQRIGLNTEIERMVSFELRTVEKGNDEQYYSLRVLPPSAPAPQTVAQRGQRPAGQTNGSGGPKPVNRPPLRSLGCPAAGCLHNSQPQDLAARAAANAANPGIGANRNYTIEGDKTLIGGGK